MLTPAQRGHLSRHHDDGLTIPPPPRAWRWPLAHELADIPPPDPAIPVRSELA